MKKINVPLPPCSKEYSKAKKAIWAKQNDQANKAGIPEEAMSDQLGYAYFTPDEKGYFDCCICGEPYRLTPGEPIPPLLHNNKDDTYWCNRCFREYAEAALAREAKE